MSNLPIVLVISRGSVKPEEIVTNIRKIPIEDDKEKLDDELNIIGYKYHLITKYYTTDILLCPLKCPLESCPLNLINFIEGILIYFDSNNRDFLSEISHFAEFVEANQVEFSILLCGELHDETENGITFKEAKQYISILDVIELDRKRDPDEQDDSDDEGEGKSSYHDPIGYDELLQAIRNFLWSNINVNDSSRQLTGYVNLGADDIDLHEIAKELKQLNETADTPSTSNTTNPQKHPTSQSGLTDDNIEHLQEEEKIEAELAGFEKLLNEVMQFKNNTSSWTREQSLAYAQGFAEMFDKLIEGSDSEVESENQSLAYAQGFAEMFDKLIEGSDSEVESENVNSLNIKNE